jgi:anaerobic dimethyl sulfoxide reductase subunit B (iron-sulfur subunit)
MAKQLGFFVSSKRCVQCHSCQVACKAVHNTELGPNWRKVLNYWEGEYPNVANKTISISCFHCEKPACLEICPAGAISKRAEDGVVVVDQNECVGCRNCEQACPYGAPQFGKNGKMQKCDLCLDRRAEGEQPACVATCPGEALAFGDVTELELLAAKKHAQKLPGKTDPVAYVALGKQKGHAPVSIDPFLRTLKPTDNGRQSKESS